jgi:hypothetical protein
MAGTAQKTPGSTTPGWEPAAEAATDTAISAWSTPAAAIAAADQYCHRLLGGAFFLPSALSDACVCCNIHSVQVLVPNQFFFQKKKHSVEMPQYDSIGKVVDAKEGGELGKKVVAVAS